MKVSFVVLEVPGGKKLVDGLGRTWNFYNRVARICFNNFLWMDSIKNSFLSTCCALLVAIGLFWFQLNKEYLLANSIKRCCCIVLDSYMLCYWLLVVRVFSWTVNGAAAAGYANKDGHISSNQLRIRSRSSIKVYML